jgi:hypothetical protein
VGSGATFGGCACAHPLGKPKKKPPRHFSSEPFSESLTPAPGLGATDEGLD